jgi:IS1 family transposase
VDAAVIPPERLVMRKRRTNGLERHHCRQRQWCGRLKRRSIMVSKARAVVDLTTALCARFRVNGDVAAICTRAMIT